MKEQSLLDEKGAWLYIADAFTKAPDDINRRSLSDNKSMLFVSAGLNRCIGMLAQEGFIDTDTLIAMLDRLIDHQTGSNVLGNRAIAVSALSYSDRKLPTAVTHYWEWTKECDQLRAKLAEQFAKECE